MNNTLSLDSAQVTRVGSTSKGCLHGLSFDHKEAKGLSVTEIRARWPRLYGPCPLGCGFDGIGYASSAHYILGDW